MRTASLAAAGAALFVVLATANAGGYRYGVSDQAFHVPALAHQLDPALFPRDQALLAAQTTRTTAYRLFALFADGPKDIPAVFGAMYLVSMLGLAAAALLYSRALGSSKWAAAGALALLTFRHRIAKTGANSIEGYFNPRMLAFAIGLGALAFVLRRRLAPAFALTIAAGLVHPTTGLWFAAAVTVAALAAVNRRPLWIAAGILGAAVFIWLAAAGTRMDEPWRAVLLEKDYLFSLEWPAYAWLLNLLYLPLIVLVYRRRRALGVLAPGEHLLIAGLSALLVAFLLSLPLTAWNVAFAVQLQVNRIFWVLDATLVLYLAWWLLDDVGGRRPAAWRGAMAGALLLLSLVRGYYVLALETKRPLVQASLPSNEWTAALQWLRGQAVDWNVLTSPGHAATFGLSVRVGAWRDTVIEQSKDAGAAIYERGIALRVAERSRALSGFETFGDDRMRAVARQFDADVALVERSHSLSFPILYENDRFVVYDLR